MKRSRMRIKRKTKVMIAKMLFDSLVKFLGIACFFIGIAGLAECPTDPKQIVQGLGMFILGLCIVGYNSHLISRQENNKK